MQANWMKLTLGCSYFHAVRLFAGVLETALLATLTHLAAALTNH